MADGDDLDRLKSDEPPRPRGVDRKAAPNGAAIPEPLEGGKGALVVHLGLPRTATTFLQYSVFAKTLSQRSNFIYVHRKRGENEKHLTRTLRKLTKAKESELAAMLSELNVRLARLKETKGVTPTNPTIIISDENISLDGKSIWLDEGPTPIEVAMRLGRWAQNSATSGHYPVRLILGIRRQDQWLASRYAQSAGGLDGFCQSDFERRLQRVCEQELQGAMQWLDYARARRALATVFGDENVLLIPIESVSMAPLQTLDSLGRFIGRPSLAEAYRRTAPKDTRIKPRNRLATGPNTWKLRGGDDITLTETLSMRIRMRFGNSNQTLASDTGLDLSFLGYFEGCDPDSSSPSRTTDTPSAGPPCFP